MAEILVNIDVDDLPRAVSFYTQAFDLRVGRRFGPHATELLGGASPLYLLAKRAGTAAVPGAPLQRGYARHWTPVHLDFVVADLESALQRAQAAGATPEGEIDTAPWGRLARLSDPWGHGFCLLQFTGRGYDEVAERRT
jgi:lactoylglutathione lyase